ncbi:MAG: hypothetical protein J5J06_17105 [Phycisphaerae bacterium]|nr:hypothetical protein [Phycisphaerae bacterium]
MRSLQVFRAAALPLVALVLLASPRPALAEDDSQRLREAVKLFDEGDYLAAQELLVAIDPEALSSDEQTRRGDYLQRVQVALTMYEKALRDLEDAETAIDDNDPARARELLNRVIENEYAAPALREAARTHLAGLDGGEGRAAARQDLIEAAGEAPADTDERRGTRPDRPSSDEVAQARQLTREGQDLIQSAQYDEAVQRFQSALELVPGLPEAVQGLELVRAHRENIAADRAESLAERIRRLDEINWQRAVANYRQLERDIRDLVSKNRYDEAQQALVRARQVLDAARQFAEPYRKYENLDAELKSLSNYVSESQRKYLEEQVAQTREEILQQRSKRLKDYEANRERQVDALMEEAEQHRKDGDLEAALNTLQQVVVIDPSYRPARMLMDILEDQRLYRKERDTKEEFYRQQRKSLLEVEEAKIPWHEEINYPDNWLEIISRPERILPGQTRVDRQLISALDRPTSVDFPKVPFNQVVERLADTHGLNIVVDWHDLSTAGVERSVTVDLTLPQEISLRKVLTEVLDQAGAGVPLDFAVQDGVINVATRDKLRRSTYTVVYDVTDLLMELPNFTDAPVPDLRHATTTAKPAIESSSMPWRVGDDDDDEAEEDPRRKELLEQLSDIIRNNVDQDSWHRNGGDVGRIDQFNGQLVVTQNAAAHGRIVGLLEQLRAERAIQISVEALFITVSSHYLEEIGIDLDVVLNAGNAGYDFVDSGTGPLTDPVLGSNLLLPRSFSRLGFGSQPPNTGLPLTTPGNAPAQPYSRPFLVPQANGGAGRQLTPVPVNNSVLGFTNPANLPSDVPGSFGGQSIPPALNVFGSFLDNIQVDFLIRATQADSRTTVLTAPRLVVFNGASAWIAVTIQQNFISQLQPVVAQGAVAQAPITGTIDAGASLFVRATVTADRRYVMMLLSPGVTRLLDLQTFNFSGGTGANQAFVQLPTLSAQRVQTLVSVPDGGTLLIGGQKLASETEVEAGVPILSRIPLLKRLYSSRTMVKDEQVLLILIKPKILIQSEQEELAYPGFAKRE